VIADQFPVSLMVTGRPMVHGQLLILFTGNWFGKAICMCLQNMLWSVQKTSDTAYDETWLIVRRTFCVTCR